MTALKIIKEKSWEFFTKNWKVKLGSVFLATIFYVNLQNSKILIKNLNIPIDYPKLEAGKYYSEDPPKTLPVRVEGLREVVNYYSQFMKAVPDFSRLNVGENKVGIKTITGVPNGVKVIKLKKNLTIQLEGQASKQVPIEVGFEGELTTNLEKASSTIRPNRVTIVGRQSDIDKINRILLPPISLQDINESFVRKVRIPDLPRGMYVSGGIKQVSVAVTIASQDSKTGEQTVTGIPLRCIGNHPRLEADLSIEQVSVKIQSKSPIKSSSIITGIQATVPCNYTLDPEKNKIIPNDQPSVQKIRVSRSRELKNIEILQIIPDRVTVTYRIKPASTLPPEGDDSDDKTEVEEFIPPPDERDLDKGSSP